MLKPIVDIVERVIAPETVNATVPGTLKISLYTFPHTFLHSIMRATMMCARMLHCYVRTVARYVKIPRFLVCIVILFPQARASLDELVPHIRCVNRLNSFAHHRSSRKHLQPIPDRLPAIFITQLQKVRINELIEQLAAWTRYVEFFCHASHATIIVESEIAGAVGIQIVLLST